MIFFFFFFFFIFFFFFFEKFRLPVVGLFPMHPGSKNTDLSLQDSGKGAKLQFSSGRDRLPEPPVFSQSFLPTGTDDRGAAAGECSELLE
jgi:hypothetical protein